MTSSNTASCTCSVRRFRLFTPIMSAPAWRARVNSDAIVDLDERGQPNRVRGLNQPPQRLIVECGDDQQRGVGARRPRLQQLKVSDDEVLAQQGQTGNRAHLAEVIEAAVEERGLGQHRNRRRSRGFVRLCDRGRDRSPRTGSRARATSSCTPQ